MTAFVFDVDGTLTPSRGVIDPKFAEFFKKWQQNHNTYLVTGSDYPKTIEQLGEEIPLKAKMVFNCSGNEVRIGKLITHSTKWDVPPQLITELHSILKESDFPIRTGNHIELRTGCINFSIVGRNATPEQRAAYVKYDEETGERITTALRLERQFDDIDFVIGGETGIDIYPTGLDKRQVRNYLKDIPLVFFGDKTLPGGNDYPLAYVSDMVHRVENWEHTWELLRTIP